MCRTSIYEARNNFSTLVKLAEEDWLMKWRKTYENGYCESLSVNS